MSNKRYVKQNDFFSCGPVAIANALKWAGFDFSYSKNRKKFIEHCKCDLIGTGTKNFERSLKEISNGLFSVKRRYGATIGEIKNHLLKGGSVIVSGKRAWEFQIGGHYFNCVGMVGKLFLVTNEIPTNGPDNNIYSSLLLTEKELRQKISPENISKETDCLYRTKYPKIWFLTKGKRIDIKKTGIYKLLNQ